MAEGKSSKKAQRKNKTFEERCQQVYDFFIAFYSKNDLSPDFTEMSKGTGIGRGNLHAYITQLLKENKLIKKADGPRGLLPAQILGSFHLHWYGHIAADNLNPLVVMDLHDSDTILEVPKHLLPKKVDFRNLYVLQVKGNSMTEANILDGDYVVMQSGNKFRDDDIVAVYIKDEGAVTLKMLKPTERGNVKLQPKSHKHQPRIEYPENIEIQGRVVAVMRKY
jgi:repressor LexA